MKNIVFLFILFSNIFLSACSSENSVNETIAPVDTHQQINDVPSDEETQQIPDDPANVEGLK